MKAKKSSGIYKITCVATSKVYVGSSFKLNRRWSEHRYHLKRGDHHNQYLQNAWNKHGASEFQFEVIEECSTDVIHEREQYWVDFYQAANSELGFNIASVISAPMTGRTQSLETRAKISAAQKGVPAPNRRHKRSSESVEKTASAHRGRKRSPETCARISAAKMGRPATPAQRAQIEKRAEAQRGKPHSAEWRANISAAKMGKPGTPHTVESRAKMSVAQRNRPPASEETKVRMSAARKAYWERKRAEKAPNNSELLTQQPLFEEA